MKHFYRFIFLILALAGVFQHLSAQCYSQPSYCMPTFTNVASYSIGIQNVTLGATTSINNTTVATGLAPNYFDYTTTSLAVIAGNTVSGSVKNGSGNSTTIRIFVDYNLDGVFSTVAPELVWSSATTTAGSTVACSFTVPAGQASGLYRMRITGDIGGSAANPCALGYGEVEDYTLIVMSTGDDANANVSTTPAFFTTGSNTIGFSFFNTGNTTITSLTVGYQLSGSGAVTQSLTSLSIAPGALFTHSFATPLSLASTGNYSMKIWVSNPNGAGNATPANDTLCRAFTVYCGSALNGTYTIDPLGSGASNFNSFGAADSALMSCGVSGPVVFNVAAASYTEQVEIGNIAGTSAVNTVTFNGGIGNAATRILTYSAASTAPHTLRLNNCSFVTFKNITIRATGATDGWAVHLMNGTNNTFSNCVLDISGAAAVSASGNVCPVVVNGGPGLSTVSATANNHTIDSCTLNAGFYNVYCAGGNGANTLNFTNNSMNSAYSYGLYFASSVVAKIRNNVINMRNTLATSVGIYFINNNASGAAFHEISGNKILNAGQYGMYFLTSSGSGSAYGKIYNNFIGGGFRNSSGAFGINDNSSRYQIYHNSINMDVATTSGTTAAIYLNGGSLHDIQNNHLVISNPAAVNAYPLFSSATGNISALNYNNYYNRSSPYLIANGPVIYDASTFKAALPAGGANSIIIDPYFVSNADLHSTVTCNTGANLTAFVSADIDGNGRSTTPDMGADEVVTVNNEIGVMKINSPAFPLTPGSNTINITLRNYGTNTVTSAMLYYSVNGAAPVAEAWSGTLNTCDTANFTFSVPYTFVSGSNNLKVYSTLPNGTADAWPANDTARFTLCAAMSGTYTIGTTGDFTTFTQAVAALQCGGVSGPVTFNVATGTYPEQVSIGIVTGVSASNSVTFQSATSNAADVNLTYSAPSTANFTLRLNGSCYYKFRNLTLSATNATYGTVLTYLNNASSDSFYNVIFNGVATVSNTTNLALVYTPITISNNFSFDTCRFNNGAYGTYIQSGSTNVSGSSSQGTSIFRCIFTNQYAYGIYNNNMDGVKVRNNSISTNSTLTTFVGIYNYWIMILSDASRPVITGNKISGALGGTGIYNNYIGVNSTVTLVRRALVANNMIQIGAAANACYGLRDDNGNGIDYIHNSIHVTTSQNTSASAAAFLNATSYGSNAVINNIFSSTTGAPAIIITNNTFYPRCDSNDLYTTGVNLGYYASVGYATLAAWRTASSRDAVSQSVNPVFAGTSDLHCNQPALNNAGNIAFQVVTDYDGQSRCPNGGCPGATARPDIGADEFTPTSNDASVQAITAPTNICPGVASVVVTLKNIGATTLVSDSIQWSVNGVIQPSFYWTGSLVQGASATGITIGSATFIAGTYTIKVWSAFPNGIADENSLNDTSTFVPGLLLNGTYTVGGVSPDFVNFSAVASVLNTTGVCGPVVFNVRQGTYTERIQLNAITGSSASNFITFQPDPSNTLPVELSIGGNSVATDNFTLFLNGTGFVKFNTLKFTNTSSGTGTFGSVVRFALAQDSVVFSNCTFTGPATTSNNVNFAVLNHGTAAVDSVKRFNLLNCQIVNGSYGVYMQGNTNVTPFEDKNTLSGNTFLNNNYMGMYARFQRNLTITGNTVNQGVNANTAGSGIYLDYCDIFRVEKNNINYFGQYGIYLSSANYQQGTGTVYSTLVNNMVGGYHSNSAAYGIFFANVTPQGSRYLKIYHNSVSVISSSTGPALNFQQTTTGMFDYLDIRNNSFANFGNGTYACYFYYSTGTPIANLIINNNNYYNAGSNLFAIAQSGYSTATGGSPTYNSASKAGDPQYLNNFTNLHTLGTQLNDAGANAASITTDIDGESRPIAPSVTVDIGADEFNVPALNIGVSSITAPACPMATGLQNVVVTMKNFGTSTITSANVKYKVGLNGTIFSQAYSGSLLSGSTVAITFTGASQYNFTGVLDSIIAWTESPNGSNDEFLGNDTLIKYVASPLSGAFTIDPGLPAGGTNFQNFATAALVLNNAGVTGPVVINVASGTYNEQVVINAICGISAVNTVTLDGGNGNAATRILSYSGNYLYPHTLRLNGSSFITVRNITLQTTGGTDGWAAHLYNTTNCRMNNCIIENAGAGAASTAANLIGVIINNGTMLGNFATASTTATQNIIDSNTIRNGFYGVYTSISNGSTTNYFSANTLNNSYSSGFYFNSSQVAKCRYNRISMRTNNNSNDGITLMNSNASGTGYHEISGNIINAGYRGIYLATSQGSGSSMGQIYNNMIGGGFRNTTPYGIYTTSSRYNIWHNNILIDNQVTGAGSCIAAISPASMNDAQNNHLSISNTGSYTAYCLFSTNNTCFSAVNYNNYWNRSTVNLLNINGTIYTNNTYKAAFPVGGGLGSIRQNPTFISSTNLHIKNPCRDGANLGVVDDADVQGRTSSPDIGADEITKLTDNLAIDSIVLPNISSIPNLTMPVTVRVQNIGLNTVTSFNLSYMVNGGTPVVIPVTATLASCDTLSITFSSVAFGFGYNVFKTYTDSPNGNTDADKSDDTAQTSFCQPLNGTYTIGGTSPDFPTFSAAVQVLNCGGVSGPVVFNVRPGVYAEQFTLFSIYGSSAVNTVTFQAENGLASSVILQYNVAGASVVELVDADNIVLQKLTIKNTLGGSVIYLHASIVSEKCDNVIIRMCNVYSTWQVGPSNAVIYATGNNTNLKIRSNTFSSTTGIYITGNNVVGAYTSGLEIDSNTFNESVASVFKPVYVTFTSAPKMRYNSIVKTGCCADWIAEFINVSGAFEFAYNKMYSAGGNGFHIQNANLNGETTYGNFYNNFIRLSTGSAATRVLFIDDCKYTNVYFNSIYQNTATVGSYGIQLSASSARNNVNVQNNNFYNNTGYAIYITNANAATMVNTGGSLNYNNYFVNGGAFLGYYNGVNYANLAAWKNMIFANSDFNSISADPLYVSANDLHVAVNSPSAGSGTVIAAITNDVDGDARITVPDIGADEVASLIRVTLGDYTVSAGCPTFSGTNWIDVTDAAGNLVFSINPNGNNLGTTCWGVRINSAPGIRTDSTQVFTGTPPPKVFGYYLDRNFYITPTNQPASAVSLKFYIKNYEYNELRDSVLLKYGRSIPVDSVDVTRFSGTPIDLNPTNNTGTPVDWALLNSGGVAFGPDYYLLLSTGKFSEFNPSYTPNIPSSPLPVRFLSFTAKASGENSELEWKTATEENAAYFEVQRSTDGVNFNTIKRIKASGNSLHTLSYRYTDLQASEAGKKLFYRIQEWDADGSTLLSNTETVYFIENISVDAEVLPNPFHNSFHIQFTETHPAQGVFRVYDVQGCCIIKQHVTTVKGRNDVEINTASLVPGIYFLERSLGENVDLRYKIIKE